MRHAAVLDAPRTPRRIPRDRSLDASLAFLREGYAFIGNRCDRLGTDVFETRLGLRRVVCMRGAEAAREFYAPDRFGRRGTTPATTSLLLQDRGSVQTLEGAAHRARKALFLAVARPAEVARLTEFFEARLETRLPAWRRARRVLLKAEVERLLCRAACAWAGVPLGDGEARSRTGELVAMIEGAGSLGPRAWRGLLLRSRTERWARALVVATRRGDLRPPDGSALRLVAEHRDAGGAPLDVDAAAVELLNVLRPTVAVARYVVFAAHALHAHPAWRERLRAGSAEDVEAFVQEVRRFYPFFPAVGGRVRQPFEWRGHRFEEGRWVLLDLYGTDHDPRLWEAPDTFRPERFLGRAIAPNELVPQGGGDPATGHRCPGEDATVALTARAVRFLVSTVTYAVPPQDLRIDLSRIPALPASGFVISEVRPAR
jgi:fatty-acid peroxygenase